MRYENPEELLALLEQSSVGAWGDDWALSQEGFVPGGVPFLKSDYVRETCRSLRMSGEVTDVLLNALGHFEKSPAIQRLAWHCHFLLFGGDDSPSADIAEWPMPPEKLGPLSHFFYAFVFLSGVPHVRALHRRLSIPDDVTIDTLSDLELWIHAYRQKTGAWGFGQKGWLMLHFSGKVFKLGRLQFEINIFHPDFNVFRNVNDNCVVVLVPDGKRFRADGQFDGVNGIYDTPSPWMSVFKIDAEKIIGNPVTPQGLAQPDRVTLDAQTWKQVLKHGDPAIGVHIPATGPMTHKACGESFARALEFFPKYFPAHDFKTFWSESWLFDTQLEDYLEADSNIVRFMREFHLLPQENSSDSQTYERVFGAKPESLDDAPRDTSLQRIIIQHEKMGKRWRSGAMLMLKDDFDWGAQVYRKMHE